MRNERGQAYVDLIVVAILLVILVVSLLTFSKVS